MRFRLEHGLPRRLRYAKVLFEAGPASVSFSLEGARADWRASIGGRTQEKGLTDRQYSILRSMVPAVETLHDGGGIVVVRNSRGEEESWLRPRWTLTRLRKPRVQPERSD